MKLNFVTSSKNKVSEAREILEGIEVEQLNADLPEIQGTDGRNIVEAKLVSAAALGQENILVEDTSLRMDALNGLPGPMVKWFLGAIGIRGLAEIAESKKMYGAKAVSVVGFAEFSKGRVSKIHLFEGETKGWIVPPKGSKGFGWDPIFLPEGSIRTFGEMDSSDKNKISHRKKALEKLKDYLAKK